VDVESRELHRAFYAPWTDDPEAAALIPTADEWAEHVEHTINLVGPDHVGIGLDIVGSRSTVPKDPSGYPLLVAAISRITTQENVRKVTGENWLRVIEATIG
jgi:membrane dipeptidase